MCLFPYTVNIILPTELRYYLPFFAFFLSLYLYESTIITDGFDRQDCLRDNSVRVRCGKHVFEINKY